LALNEGGDATIKSVQERKNEFRRPQVSNVDCFVVVAAAAKPAPSFSVIDRFLVMAEDSGADVMICINKIDIAGEAQIREIEEIYKGVYPVIKVSALSGLGVDSLTARMENGRYALAGPSGAGKSTLLNAMSPSAMAETGEISRKTQRGKHTTRHTEIFELPGHVLIYDTPGFSSFDVNGVAAEELQHLFPEISALYGKCRYSNCIHLKEAGCAVREAVDAGLIHISRYGSYKEIMGDVKGV